MSVVDRLPRRWLPRPETAMLAAVAIVTEGLLATLYLAITRPAGFTQPVFVVAVPFVWLNLALLVFLRVRPAASDARRWPAVLVAGGYFVLLAVLGGVVIAGGDGAGLRTQVAGFPGWVPLLIYDAGLASVVVVPYKLLGYLALTYLVYVTAVDAAGALVGGVVGIFSCVSCTFPLIAGVVTSLTGGGGAAAAAAYSNSQLLSTVVFAVTVALLVWRPSLGALRRLHERFPR